MTRIQAVCVYCGSGLGTDPAYAEAARGFGRILAAAQIRLVYGGGSLGLMGTLARSVIEHGGKVTGIIPQFLVARERMMREVDELLVTEDMHARKRAMFDRADGFVALPGGLGTLEETVEMLTWAQLGQHEKPVVLANIAGFWQPLIALMTHMRAEAFIREGLMARYFVAETVEQIVPTLKKAAAICKPTDQGAGAPSFSNL
ncbi:MAG: TIGR00730 family Rossman fold protein [Hyphomicrobiales bacterium]|jgi:hypothetical protein|nr:TIGR00730 family Rossman fold protein [Hyphomicrobiales bacterium]